jgi:NADPH-dependent glutamate synthase beta subunit-like oxidoreductase/ferredoxin
MAPEAKPIVMTVNGRTVCAAEGKTVLDASLEAGIYIPHLCSHPMLKPQGGCKLCCVEISGREGCASSCGTPAEQGLVIRTNSEYLTRLRRAALELLLACHPADCTSCAAYLNCELQALMQYTGVVHAGFRRTEKQNTRLAAGPPNPLIKREAERCVQCGRCVRACRDLRGVGALEYRKRDGESYVGVKDDVSLTESDCRFCGACAEICPTGAIQDMPGVFPPDMPRAQALTPCKSACPAHTDVYAYIRLAGQGRYAEAASVIREKLTFPHVLGHVCTHKCEYDCKRGRLDSALSIREIKRFAIENDADLTWRRKVKKSAPTGKRVAVIGAGPAGLTAAWHLSRKGHEVVVLERESLPGGLMRYGIPAYRLPRADLDAEIDIIEDMGVKIHTNADVRSAPAIKENFDAVLVAVGAHSGSVSDAEAAVCENVWPALAFCRLANMGKLPDVGDTLTVIGGGSVAFDCARIAGKAGVKTVRVLCLEKRGQMLADEEEVTAAAEEGTEILNGVTVVGIRKEGARVVGLEYMNVLRFSFEPEGLVMEKEENSETFVATDSLIYAVGQRIDLTDAFGLALGRANSVKIDAGYATDVKGIFAAGDVATGTKTIVDAIAAAAAASSSVDRYLGGDGDMTEVYWERERPRDDIGLVPGFAKLERAARIRDGEEEKTECGRCLQCDLRLNIPKVKYWGDKHFRGGGGYRDE